MNMFRRLALSSTMALSFGAVSFGQHYTQTNLQANTSGAAEATDPQLVNSWGLSAPPAAPAGLQTMRPESLRCTTAQERNSH